MGTVHIRGEKIRRYILDQVEKSPKGVAKATAKRFGISRQAANKHLQRLCEEGVLERSGSTSSTRYRLAMLSQWTGAYMVETGLAEDVVWAQDVQEQLHALADNATSLWHYAFTEMFNNAIDHSEGSQIGVGVTRTAVSTEMVIHDDGCGIFKKIQKALGLLDERHAVLELSKGKFTTDPENHPGEGIFFTSRMFDSFAILSGSVCFSHKSGSVEDWVQERGCDPGDGTFILMNLKNTATRTATKIFAQFSSEDGVDFIRTVIPVRMAQLGEDWLVSRAQAKRLLARVEEFRKVTFDFDEVKVIGPAFADEIFRVFALRHPDIELVSLNANLEVEKMVAKARNSAVEVTAQRLK